MFPWTAWISGRTRSCSSLTPAEILRRWPAARLSLYALLVGLIAVTAGEVQTFIYFQF